MFIKKTHWILLASLWAFLACEDSGDNGVIKAAEGGTVKSADNNVTLQIPPGALAQDTAVTIEAITKDQLPAALKSRETIKPPYYRLLPEGLTFAKPVQLKVLLPGIKPPADKASAMPPSAIVTYSAAKGMEPLGGWYTGEAPRPEQKLELDPDTNTLSVTGTLTHFSCVFRDVNWHLSWMLQRPPLTMYVGQTATLEYGVYRNKLDAVTSHDYYLYSVEPVATGAIKLVSSQTIKNHLVKFDEELEKTFVIQCTKVGLGSYGVGVVGGLQETGKKDPLDLKEVHKGEYFDETLKQKMWTYWANYKGLWVRKRTSKGAWKFSWGARIYTDKDSNKVLKGFRLNVYCQAPTKDGGADKGPAVKPVNNTCEYAKTVAVPPTGSTKVTGDTTLATNDFSKGEGNEVYFVLNVPLGGVRLKFKADKHAAAMFLLWGAYKCQENNKAFSKVLFPAGGSSSIFVHAPAPMALYLIIDAMKNQDFGPFELEVSKPDTNPCPAGVPSNSDCKTPLDLSTTFPLTVEVTRQQICCSNDSIQGDEYTYGPDIFYRKFFPAGKYEITFIPDDSRWKNPLIRVARDSTACSGSMYSCENKVTMTVTSDKNYVISIDGESFVENFGCGSGTLKIKKL